MAEELNREASELINAAKNAAKQTKAFYSSRKESLATSVGKAASAFAVPLASRGRKPSHRLRYISDAGQNAIIPGIKNRNTGNSFRYAPKIVPRRALFRFYRKVRVVQ